MSGPYHERRTVGEVHFVCFFTGDAAARPATIAAKRILLSLVMSKFFTLKDRVIRWSKKEGKVYPRRETFYTMYEIHI
jgi:hypothetical protein